MSELKSKVEEEEERKKERKKEMRNTCLIPNSV